MPKNTSWAVLHRRNMGEDGNSRALPTPHKRPGQGDGEAVCLSLGFFSPSDLIFRGFFNLNPPWLPWLLQGEPFLLPGDSGTADRLAPASPWLFGPCCPSHPSRDLTFPQQVCNNLSKCCLHREAQHRNRARIVTGAVELLHLPSSFWMSSLVQISSLSPH